ncbi:hypothetical protein ACR42D_00645 [Desulfovibrio caledoniensis]
MFGWNNDAYGGRGFGRGNRGQGRGRRGGAEAGFGQGDGRGRSGKGVGRSLGRGRNRSGYGDGFGPCYGQSQERFDDFGQSRMGRGPCGMGLNRFWPGRSGAYRQAMDTADGFGSSFGPEAGVCPLCEQHCPLSAPSCPKGEAYAARMR